jgi:uncharacterized repeat protein (TIGR02543 family)
MDNYNTNVFAALTARKGKARKLIAFTLAALMVFCFIPALAWQSGDNVAYATIETPLDLPPSGGPGDDDPPGGNASAFTVVETDADRAALAAKLGADGSLEDFAWSDEDGYPDPTPDLEKLAKMYGQLNELKTKYNESIADGADAWTDENADVKQNVLEGISALEEKYKAYKDAVSDYLDAAEAYQENYSEYAPVKGEYDEAFGTYEIARTAFTSALTSDLTALTNSPVTATASNVSIGTATVLGQTVTVGTNVTTPIAQTAVAAAKSLKILSELSRITGTSLPDDITAADYLDRLTKEINDSIVKFADVISGAGIINVDEPNSGGSGSGSKYGIPYSYSFTYDAIYTYTIPEATDNAAKAVINTYPGSAPIPPATDALKAAYVGIGSLKTAASVAFDETNLSSDYSVILKALEKALNIVPVIVKGTSKGEAIHGTTLHIPASEDDATTTTTIDLSYEAFLEGDDVGIVFDANVSFAVEKTAGNDGIAELAADVDGLLTITTGAVAGVASYSVSINVDSEEIASSYTLKVTPLTFTINVYGDIYFDVDADDEDGVTVAQDEEGNYTVTILAGNDDSSKDPYTVELPAPKSLRGAAEYRFTDGVSPEKWSRITLSEGGVISVGKDANAGDYEYTVTVTDAGRTPAAAASEGDGGLSAFGNLFSAFAPIEAYADEGDSDSGASLVITVTQEVYNEYDAKYEALLADLTEIQKQIDEYIELVDGEIDPEMQILIDTLRNAKGTLQAIWNDGQPQLSKTLIEQPLKAGLASLGFGATTIDGLYGLIPGGTWSIDKKSAVEGYSYSIGGGYTIQLSPLVFYHDLVMNAWAAFEGEFVPIDALYNAYNDLSDYVTKTDYAKLTSVNAVNDYVQGLYVKYAAFDTALADFDGNSAYIASLIDGVLENAGKLIGAGLDLAKGSKSTLLGLIDGYIGQIDAAYQEQIRELIDQAFDATIEVVEGGVNQLPPEFTLADLVKLSAGVEDALLQVANVSALIKGAIDMGGYDFLQYDLAQIDQLSTYVEEIYAAYAEAVGDAAGVNGTAILAKLETLKTKLTSDPNVKTAIEAYFEIAEIYVQVREVIGKAIDYIGAADLQGAYADAAEAVISSLTNLAELTDKVHDGQIAQTQLNEQIKTLLIAVIEAATTEFANVDDRINETLTEALAALDITLADLPVEELSDALLNAAHTYHDALAVYEEVAAKIKLARDVYGTISDFIAGVNPDEIRAQVKAEIIGYLEQLSARAKELATNYVNVKLEELTAELDQLIADLKSGTEAQIRAALDKIRPVVEDIVESLRAKAQTLSGEAAEYYNLAVAAATNVLKEIDGVIDDLANINYKEELQNILNAVEGKALKLASLIEASIEAIPNPEILADGNEFVAATGAVRFSTSIDWLFDALQKVGVRPPAYELSGDADALNVLQISKDGVLSLKDGVDSYDNKVYTVTVSLKFSGKGISADLAATLSGVFNDGEKTITVKLPLDYTVLNEAVAAAETLSGEADDAIAAITEKLEDANAIDEPTAPLNEAIAGLEDALANVEAEEAALVALLAATPDEFDAQVALDEAAAAINTAIGVLNAALDDLAAAEAALDSVLAGEHKVDPVVTPGAVWIYKGDDLPSTGFATASVRGDFEWDGDSAPTATDDAVPATFKPETDFLYNDYPFTVSVNVVDKGDLDDYLAYARYVSRLIEEKGWVASERITQEANDALADALAAAEGFYDALPPASAAAEETIDELTSDLTAALEDLNFNELDNEGLTAAITSAISTLNDADGAVADADAAVKAAEAGNYHADAKDAVNAAIGTLETSKAAVVAAKAALDELRQAGIEAFATAAFQSELDEAADAIGEAEEVLKDALADLADALANLAAAIDAANGVVRMAPPSSDASAFVLFIYDNEGLPAAPEKAYDVPGAYAWREDAAPAQGVQKVVFTPDDEATYTSAEYDVTVNVVTGKQALDDEIANAETLLSWLDNGRVGNESGQVTQVLRNALKTAIDAAKRVAAEDAGKAGQKEAITSALAALQTAVKNLKITLPAPPTPVIPDREQSGGKGAAVDSSVKVVFHANKGSLTVGGKQTATHTITLKPGAEIGALPKPTRENYKFDGWYAAGSTKKVTTKTKATENLALTAQWHRIAYAKIKTNLMKRTDPKVKVLASIKQGKKLYVTSQSKYGKHFQVKVGKKTGWVLAKHLVLQSTRYAKKAAWLLKSASADSTKVVKVKKDGKLTVINASGKYYKVQYKAKGKTYTGYILKKSVKVNPSKAKAAA